MSENFEDFNMNFSYGRPSVNVGKTGSVKKNQKVNINIIKINNSIGKDLFKEIEDKESKVKRQLKEIKSKTIQKEFEKNMEGVGKGIMDDLKKTDESILEIKKYKDYRFNEKENIYIPGIEQVTKLKPVKIPDYLGFTKEEHFIEKYGKELTSFCREVLGLDQTLIDTLKYVDEVDNLESILTNPKLKTLYYRDPYYLMLKSFKKGELDLNAFGRPLQDDKKKKNKKKDKKEDKQKGGKKGKKKHKKKDKKGEKKGSKIEGIMRYILILELGGDVTEVNKYLNIYKTLNIKFANFYKEKSYEKIKELIGEDAIDKFNELSYQDKSNILSDKPFPITNKLNKTTSGSVNESSELFNKLFAGYQRVLEDDIFGEIYRNCVEDKYEIYDFNTDDLVRSNQKVKLKLIEDETKGYDRVLEIVKFLVYLKESYDDFYSPKKYQVDKLPSVMDSATNRNSVMKLVLKGIEVYLLRLRKSFNGLVDFIKKDLINNKNKLLSESEKRNKELGELKKIKNDLNKKIGEIKSEEKKKKLKEIKDKVESKIKKIE